MCRKSKYDPDTFPDAARDLATKGLNDEQICKALGITTSTYYKYQNKYPEFRDAIRKGKAPADDNIENSLYRSACGYFVDEEFTETTNDNGREITKTRITRKYITPSVTAQIFWLVNRRREKWQSITFKHEVGGIGDYEKILAEISAEVEKSDTTPD